VFVACSPRVLPVRSTPLVQMCSVEPSSSIPVGSTPVSSDAKAARLGLRTTWGAVQLKPSVDVV